MMRRNGESWLISDIYLDGASSEVATRRCADRTGQSGRLLIDPTKDMIERTLTQLPEHPGLSRAPPQGSSDAQVPILPAR
jgi:hypothetical protein